MTWKSKAWLAPLLIGLACGPTPRSPGALLAETFESRCGELPCGWSRIAGNEDQALYAATVHPDEHGLILRGDGVRVGGPGADESLVQTLFGSVEAQLAARCDSGATLTLELAVATPDGDSAGQLDTLTGTANPAPTWQGPTYLTMTASVLPDAGAGGGTSTVDIVPLGLTIRKNGPGQCVINAVRIFGIGNRPQPGESC